MSKRKTRAELEEEILSLQYDNDFLNQRISEIVHVRTTQAPTIPTASKAKPQKYERFWTVSLELNPAKWFSKPMYYRFNWQQAGSPVREGQADFGPFSFFWYRDIKR